SRVTRPLPNGPARFTVTPPEGVQPVEIRNLIGELASIEDLDTPRVGHLRNANLAIWQVGLLGERRAGACHGQARPSIQSLTICQIE
ncbi:MAG: hypothetical protein M0008_14375, partial [Actinomycetota bacterium]|nr:hypothetical protein [Actinomycetota bacterium]